MAAQHHMVDMASDEFWNNQAKCSSEKAHEVLVLRRSLLGELHGELEDAQRQNISSRIKRILK